MSVLQRLEQHHGIRPKKAAGTKGGEYHSACPGCGGTDRFHCWPEQNSGEGSWWCRACDRGGDLIEFLRQFEGLGFREAAAIAGREVEPSSVQRLRTPGQAGQRREQVASVDPEPVADPDEAWQERAQRLCEWAHQQLLQRQDILDWLASRGIERKTVCRFGLGWNSGKHGDDRRDMFRPRESWGLPPAYRDDGRAKKLWLPVGLVIPMWRDGQVYRVRIRRPEGDPRYYVLPGSASEPVPMFFAPSSWPGQHQAVVVCEAELDAMLIAQAAGDLVGSLAVGSSSAKPRDEVSSRAVRDAAWIGLALDRDDAGDKALAWWLDAFPVAQDIRPIAHKDPGDMAKAGGDVRAWIQAALPPAWRIGPSRSGEPVSQGAGAQARQDQEGGISPRPAQPSRLPVSVARFGSLLQHVRAWMVYSDARIGLYGWQRDASGTVVGDPVWMDEHPDDAREVHDLFWYDRDVERYLAVHPDRENAITGANFWRGYKRFVGLED